jgi:hypothetical protein
MKGGEVFISLTAETEKFISTQKEEIASNLFENE